MGWNSSVLIIVLVFGILFSMLYFTSLKAAMPKTVIVVIPKGSSDPSSEHNNFEPSVITVVIEVNNTVRWVNHDTVPSTIIANNNDDPDFLRATDEKRNSENALLLPNDTFQYTFTKEGRFDYHSEPHPWKHGTVIVVPQK